MRFYTATKRTLDLVLAISLLAITWPALLGISILIRTSYGRPVLFRQWRPGLDGRPFRLVKFRTMKDAHDQSGKPLPDSERLTRLGRFLRATSLDELPELWNVLRGEMSLVGPRPLLMEYLGCYTPDQARRHEVRPGITGWAQVHGRNAVSWEDRFRLDVWYVDHASIWLDLKILATTVLTVLLGRGVTAEGHATMPRFRGSGGRQSKTS
jgi:lipopolysaccharide/colanic/teichoic acid biosynthesis glycosyltransferase